MEEDSQIKTETKKMQMEILLRDSDLKKNMRLKIEAETTLRDLNHKKSLLEVEIHSKEDHLKKLEVEIIEIQNELIKMKHKMSALGR